MKTSSVKETGARECTTKSEVLPDINNAAKPRAGQVERADTMSPINTVNKESATVPVRNQETPTTASANINAAAPTPKRREPTREKTSRKGRTAGRQVTPAAPTGGEVSRGAPVPEAVVPVSPAVVLETDGGKADLAVAASKLDAKTQSEVASATAAVVAAKLSPEETASLERYEKTIAQGLSYFQEVGAALMAIRDGKLYRETFKTFEAYLKSKWGIGRAHAYRLIEAKKIVAALSPQGDKPAILPTQEALVRPLVGYKPEDRQAAWTAAVAKAGSGPVTAKMVKAEVAKFVPITWRKNRAKAPAPPTKAGTNGGRLGNKELNKALGLVNEIGKLVKESGDPKAILKLVNKARETLMTLIKG